MTVCHQHDKGIRVEVEEPVPFEGEKRRTLLIAAALASPSGSSDPLDLALLDAASRQEDLGRYEQVGCSALQASSLHSVARVRHVGSEVERLIARGELQAILDLCGRAEAARVRARLQAEPKLMHGWRELAVAIRTLGAARDGKWRFLGYVPVRTLSQRGSRQQEQERCRHHHLYRWPRRALYCLALLIVLLAAALGMAGGGFLHRLLPAASSTPPLPSSATAR